MGLLGGTRFPRAPEPRPDVRTGPPTPTPGAGSSYKGQSVPGGPEALQPKKPPPAYGSESGPGILEQWFKQRAMGADPAFEYGLTRG